MKKGVLVGVGFTISHYDTVKYRGRIDDFTKDRQIKSSNRLGQIVFNELGDCKEIDRSDPLAKHYESRYVVVTDEAFKELMVKLERMGLQNVNDMLIELIK